MPNNIKNWTYSDVKKFLLGNGFMLLRTKGSHHQFSGHQNGIFCLVTVPFHGKKSIPPRTMGSIIVQSGISKKKWFGYNQK